MDSINAEGGLDRIITKLITSNLKSINSAKDYSEAENYLDRCEYTRGLVSVAFGSELKEAKRRLAAAKKEIKRINTKIMAYIDRIQMTSLNTKQMMDDFLSPEPSTKPRKQSLEAGA